MFLAPVEYEGQGAPAAPPPPERGRRGGGSFARHGRPWPLTGTPGGPLRPPAPAAERAGNAKPVVVVPVAGGVPVAVGGAEALVAGDGPVCPFALANAQQFLPEGF